ncbi:MAG: hypothetical protein UW79_C0015G0016 [Candidatus Yanofskybacteria bacterium GW2011_GWA2_44_9]|uniref:Uncharacterized protein n=1 Tax=Candidatus Yanofskybacteria bacterium GW2011_GWA2_44_9 TaxID=1619025 RepID=A0A0G1MLU9_9BACT|nr:MAG: hypothetical protein UW79_C0015G0016 [Candidatus Yanofskybacteria bacterium GW2011_GWA2_44_9]OGN05052.1 MAG: hypothetical protein A2659_01325 [Candidatus Yanofskybacteria bacterium RIFCSPHIGHO2_01_FULL_44_24]
MKNISNMLGRGNLTPKERYLLLIHNDVQKLKTGKEALTSADKEALESWRAQTNEEAREWNQLNEGWKLSGRMDLEAEFAFKDAQVAYLSQKPIMIEMIFYSSQRQANLYIKNLERIKKVTIEGAAEIAKKQKEAKLKEGLDFDYVVYRLAFELLEDKDRKQMKELYPDIETDHQYLDQEEVIAHLYNGKKELSEEAKDKLAELVAEQSYNKFAEEYQFFHYFACIPILEVAKYFLKTHQIEINNEPKDQDDDKDRDLYEEVEDAMKKYAKENETDIKTMIRQACRKWLDHDLLEQYMPLIASNSSELLKSWFRTKAKARKILNKHIASGELVARNRTAEETRKQKLYSKGLIDSELNAAMMVFEKLDLDQPKGEIDEKKAFEKFSDSVITGESLYAFGGKYEFIDEFKKQADTYDPNLGIVYDKNDPEHEGEHLDQELLICPHNSKGEAVFFSQYGLSIRMISSLLNSMTLFEEYTKDGNTLIKFKNVDIAKVFMIHRQRFIDSYSILLGFEVIFKMLTPIYETDMTDHVSGRLDTLREYAEEFNQAIRKITNTEEKLKKVKNRLFRRKETVLFEEDPLIDVEAIKPDQKVISENEAKVREVFPRI